MGCERDGLSAGKITMMGTLLMTDTHNTPREKIKHLWVRKVNLTRQQSTKVISEHTQTGRRNVLNSASTLVGIFCNEDTAADMQYL